jgi:hypothetical protein
MTLGAFPAAEFLHCDFVVFQVFPEFFIPSQVVLESMMNFFVVATAGQVNFSLVMAFNAPAHGQGWFGQFNQTRVLVDQLIDVIHFSYPTHGVGFYITMAILTLQASYHNVLLVAEENVIRKVVDFIPSDRIALV